LLFSKPENRDVKLTIIYLERFLLRLAKSTALAFCFYRNFYPKTASHFSEVALGCSK